MTLFYTVLNISAINVHIYMDVIRITEI
nr:unnamed protein product [Callosobruchus analis]